MWPCLVFWASADEGQLAKNSDGNRVCARHLEKSDEADGRILSAELVADFSRVFSLPGAEIPEAS